MNQKSTTSGPFENFIMNTLAVQTFTVRAEVDKNKFMQEAAQKIALKILESGCLMHYSEYNWEKQMTEEVITIVVGKRKGWLP